MSSYVRYVVNCNSVSRVAIKYLVNTNPLCCVAATNFSFRTSSDTVQQSCVTLRNSADCQEVVLCERENMYKDSAAVYALHIAFVNF